LYQNQILFLKQLQRILERVEKLAKERYKFLPLSDSNLLPISVVGRKSLPDAKNSEAQH
jgi:hypothetical protein